MYDCVTVCVRVACRHVRARAAADDDDAVTLQRMSCTSTRQPEAQGSRKHCIHRCMYVLSLLLLLFSSQLALQRFKCVNGRLHHSLLPLSCNYLRQRDSGIMLTHVRHICSQLLTVCVPDTHAAAALAAAAGCWLTRR